jgi:hypothetical protein
MAGNKGRELMVRADDGALVHVSGQLKSPFSALNPSLGTARERLPMVQNAGLDSPVSGRERNLPIWVPEWLMNTQSLHFEIPNHDHSTLGGGVSVQHCSPWRDIIREGKCSKGLGWRQAGVYSPAGLLSDAEY